MEIEENGGEGKEERQFFWSGLPIIFLHYADLGSHIYIYIFLDLKK